MKQVLPQLVPKVDADGNEIAGVKSPLQMAPLGTYTGWNVMSSGPFKGQMCQFGIAGGRVHSVREDESRATGERRSTARRSKSGTGRTMDTCRPWARPRARW